MTVSLALDLYIMVLSARRCGHRPNRAWFGVELPVPIASSIPTENSLCRLQLTRETRDDLTGSCSWQARDYREVLATDCGTADHWHEMEINHASFRAAALERGWLVRQVRAWTLGKQGTAFQSSVSDTWIREPHG